MIPILMSSAAASTQFVRSYRELYDGKDEVVREDRDVLPVNRYKFTKAARVREQTRAERPVLNSR
jgi:hypothetical protein